MTNSKNYNPHNTSLLPVATARGRRVRRLSPLLLSVSGGIAGWVARDGRVYAAADGLLPALTAEQAQAAIEEHAREWEESLALCRQQRAAKIEKHEAIAQQVAEIAEAAGLTCRLVVPGDSTSRYIFVTARDGRQIKIRVADHPQHVQCGNDGWAAVGGYCEATGRRHDAADISLDPESGKSLDDVRVALIDG